MKRLGSIFCICGIVTFILVGFRVWNIPINTNYTCNKFMGGNVLNEQLNVRLDGRLRKSLFRKNRYEVDVIVGAEKLPDLIDHPNVMSYWHSGVTSEWYSETNELRIRCKLLNYIDGPLDEIGDFYIIRLAYEYIDDLTGAIGYKTYGIMYIDKDFEDLVVGVYESNGNGGQGWSSIDGINISTASTTQELQDLFNKIYTK